MQNERFEDCNKMQLISSDSLTPFVYTTRCRDDFNLSKEYYSGSAEYANLKICILQNERLKDCNDMQLISSDSLTLFIYTTRCRNDFNLNKVAEFHGVDVLNINELANAVKPVVLPGEELVVMVVKDGKESGQGVAYLDDGTMIVVDSGRKHIGETIGVMVTSVLQTAAGRMIFAKPKYMVDKAV